MQFQSDKINGLLKAKYQHSSIEYKKIYNLHIINIYNFQNIVQNYSKYEKPEKCDTLSRENTINVDQSQDIRSKYRNL